MSLTLRIALIAGAVLLAAFAVICVRKSRMRIEDSVFWLGFAAVVLVFGVFPEAGYALSGVFGFQAPVNFIFALFIFALTVKCLAMSRHISELEHKLRDLVQDVAVDRFEHNRDQ